MDAELQKRVGEWRRSGALAQIDKVVADYGLRSLEHFVGSLDPKDAQKVVGAVQRRLSAKSPPEAAAREALKEVTGRDAAAFKAMLDEGNERYTRALKQLMAEFKLHGDGEFWKDFSARVQKRREQHPKESFEQAARATAQALQKR